MRFYRERHIESEYEIGLKNKWFWLRIGKFSYQINMGSMNNC